MHSTQPLKYKSRPFPTSSTQKVQGALTKAITQSMDGVEPEKTWGPFRKVCADAKVSPEIPWPDGTQLTAASCAPTWPDRAASVYRGGGSVVWADGLVSEGAFQLRDFNVNANGTCEQHYLLVKNDYSTVVFFELDATCKPKLSTRRILTDRTEGHAATSTPAPLINLLDT